jgi:hypothetical protein
MGPCPIYCRVLREDPNKPDYCLLELSEAFMFPLTMEILGKNKLESTANPIRDLRIQKKKDLIKAHGRAFCLR